MRRFIFRNQVVPTGKETQGRDDHPFIAGSTVNPTEAAAFHNAVQDRVEGSRLGIPVLVKSNARNNIDPETKPGINESAGAFTAFPKKAGLAAAVLGSDGDLSVIETCAEIMGREWRALGLCGMSGYMVDQLPEPGWYRAHECFSQDAELTAESVRALIGTLQGTEVEDGVTLSANSDVLQTIKHFPRGRPPQLGLDPHYSFEDPGVPRRDIRGTGTDTLSGVNDVSGITELVDSGLVSEDRVDLAARRLLEPMFRLGLFENPYVGEEEAVEAAFERADHDEAAPDLQRSSMVLPQNSGVLPLAPGSTVHVLGEIDPEVVASYGFEVIDGNAGDGGQRPSAEGADVVLVTLTSNAHGTDDYRSAGPDTGMRQDRISPIGFPGVRGLDGTSCRRSCERSATRARSCGTYTSASRSCWTRTAA